MTPHPATSTGADAIPCPTCGHAAAPSAPAPATFVKPAAMPEGVAEWSWGAFLLNPIWAIQHRAWIGLLIFVPYVGLGVAFWLGFKGREIAWKKGQWDSYEHFDRVQAAWSRWGIGLVVALLLAAILAYIGNALQTRL